MNLHIRRLTKLFFIIPLILAVGYSIQAAENAVITLDPATQYQTITGWETTAQAGQEAFPDLFAKYKDELFDRAVNELGLTRVRLEIRASAEHSRDLWKEQSTGAIDYATWRASRYTTVNDNDDPNTINPAGFQFASLDNTVDNVVLPLKKKREENGERLWVNLNYVAFTGQNGPGTSYHHADPQEYAEFVLAAFQHLKEKYGWTPDTWEVLLEPDNVSQWNGRLLGQAIAASDERLKAAGFSTRFVAPSNTNMANAITYFDAMIKVLGVLPVLEELCYHRYGGVSDANLKAIGSRAQQYSIRTSMLEHIGSGHEDLHKDLKLGLNSAWAQFTLAWIASQGSDDGGKYYIIDDTNPNTPIVKFGNRTKYLKQYFRYIRPGMTRIEAKSSLASLDPLAFARPDGGTVVVIKATTAGTASIQGLPAGTYGIRHTTSREVDMSQPEQTIEQSEALDVSIPAAGVLTVYAQNPITATPDFIQHQSESQKDSNDSERH